MQVGDLNKIYRCFFFGPLFGVLFYTVEVRFIPNTAKLFIRKTTYGRIGFEDATLIKLCTDICKRTGTKKEKRPKLLRLMADCAARQIDFVITKFLKQQAAVDTVTRDEQIGRITELQDFIRSQPADLTEFDEVLVKHWVQKITVWPDHYTVELKSGLSVDIEG